MGIASRREVIATLTADLGKILKGMHSIKADGAIDFLSALAVAQVRVVCYHAGFLAAMLRHSQIWLFVVSGLKG